MIALLLFACNGPELIDSYSPLTLAPGEAEMALVYKGPGLLLDWSCSDELSLVEVDSEEPLDLPAPLHPGYGVFLSVSASGRAVGDGACTITTSSGADSVEVIVEVD